MKQNKQIMVFELRHNFLKFLKFKNQERKETSNNIYMVLKYRLIFLSFSLFFSVIFGGCFLRVVESRDKKEEKKRRRRR